MQHERNIVGARLLVTRPRERCHLRAVEVEAAQVSSGATHGRALANLGQDEARGKVVEVEAELVLGVAWVERCCGGSNCRRGEQGSDEERSVGNDDGDSIAALDTGGREASGELVNIGAKVVEADTPAGIRLVKRRRPVRAGEQIGDHTASGASCAQRTSADSRQQPNLAAPLSPIDRDTWSRSSCSPIAIEAPRSSATAIELIH